MFAINLSCKPPRFSLFSSLNDCLLELLLDVSGNEKNKKERSLFHHNNQDINCIFYTLHNLSGLPKIYIWN